MGPEEDSWGHKEALNRGMEEATAKGLAEEQAESLYGIIPPHVNAFRRTQHRDRPVRVEPMRDKLDLEAQAFGDRCRRYDSTKSTSLACMAALTAFELVLMDLRTPWASRALLCSGT